MDSQQNDDRNATGNRNPAPTNASQSIDWYSEGQSRVVEIGDVQVTVRCVGRKGRRARISITAPAGAVFQPLDSGVA